MRWKLRTNGEFEIQSFYCGLRTSSFFIFPWKAIWVWCVFYRDFVWLVKGLVQFPPNVFRFPFFLYIALCLFCNFVATSCFSHVIVFLSDILSDLLKKKKQKRDHEASDIFFDTSESNIGSCFLHKTRFNSNIK